MERYICIHGHFYQPPRENAWLEYVEWQDSAYPYHDWNETVTAECYLPEHLVAHPGRRRLDHPHRQQLRQDQLQLRPHAARLDGGDGSGRLPGHHRGRPGEPEALLRARLGLAQAYNHLIMPLANRRDKVQPGRLGHPRLRAPLRAAAGRHVAPGDGRRPRDAGHPGGAGHQVHHPRAAPGRAGRAASAPPTGRTSPGPASTPPGPTWSGCRPAAISTSSSTTAPSPTPSPSRTC